jgi:DNA-binding IclR family transcriptional regulator
MKKKRVKKEKGRNRGEIRHDFSGEQILELMAEEDRPLLLREILRRLGLQDEQRHQARESLRDLADEGTVTAFHRR